MDRTIEDFVRGLALDAYLVGGAVRDELLGLDSKDADFVVPGVDHVGLRRALESHGRVEDLEVAGRRVGARLYPRDPKVRAAAPAGIEFAPPRAERSTGPGRHDFEIVADLERGVLRTVGPRSFAEDPLRIVRGLRLVSQLGLTPDDATLQQMRDEAQSVRLVSGERVGGGLHADGMGELSKLLLGREPARALRLARDTGVLTALLPELEDTVGFEQESKRQNLPLDEHIFAVVQAAADAGASLPVRLAALLHDAGKTAADGDHAERGARLAHQALGRLRYPARLRTYVTRLVRSHPFSLEDVDERFARRFLRDHGDELAFDLVAFKQADLRGKRVSQAEHDAAARLRTLLEQERRQPHRLEDLAVDGSDLLELGYAEGPELGRALDALLDAVVDEPALNTREQLLARARTRVG